MKQFSVKIEVKLKPVVLDPQGKAVLNALSGLGFSGVSDARVAKSWSSPWRANPPRR